MRAFPRILFVLAVAAAAGCSDSADDGDGGELLFHTGEFQVDQGDVFECFYTDVVTDRELATTGAFGNQVGSGGHHITVYFTMDVKEVGHHPCQEEEMMSWTMVGGTGAEGNVGLTLPDGLALRIPAGAQIVIQTHYINTGETAVTADETFGIYLVDPSKVASFARQFVVANHSFLVPPHETLQVEGTCTVPRDVQLVKLLGHMHEWGTRFRLDEVDASGEVVRSLIDDDVTPIYASHPPVASFDMSEPLVIRAGTRLRQTCDWNNYDEYELVYPREMCVAFGLHFGEPEDDVYCDAGG